MPSSLRQRRIWFALYLAPRYFRFDLKSFGDRQILLGSNAEHFWFYSKQDDSYYCGHQGSGEDVHQIGVIVYDEDSMLAGKDLSNHDFAGCVGLNHHVFDIGKRVENFRSHR